MKSTAKKQLPQRLSPCEYFCNGNLDGVGVGQMIEHDEIDMQRYLSFRSVKA